MEKNTTDPRDQQIGNGSNQPTKQDDKNTINNPSRQEEKRYPSVVVEDETDLIEPTEDTDPMSDSIVDGPDSSVDGTKNNQNNPQRNRDDEFREENPLNTPDKDDTGLNKRNESFKNL